MTVRAFLGSHIAALSTRYDVDVVLDSAAESIAADGLRIAVVHRARIRRTVSPVADCLGVLQLARIFRRGRYAAVHSFTSKAGLLSALAGFIAGVPVRVHNFTGQVWATRTGPWRLLLRALDTLIARLDTHVLSDSASQLEFLRENGVLGREQGAVLARGSLSGVDTARFRADAALRVRTRSELDIPGDALVFVFLGRMKRDKGVLDLARAFGQIASDRGDLYLLCVGPDEDALAEEVRAACGPAATRLRAVAGWTSTPERYIAASDVACLPSYRESFGVAIIEAAAAGLPAIGSRIYGIVDAIEENRTGLLVEAGNVADLAAAMRALAADGALRARLAGAARERVIRDFSKEAVTRAMVDFYERVVPAPPAP